MASNPLEFAHRFNEDGTVDSICRHCFETVARHQREASLEEQERCHICDQHVLARFQQEMSEKA